MKTRSVAWNTSPSRLDAVSSAPMIRKLDGLARTTSRRNEPSVRVGSVSVVPGLSTDTA